MDHNQDRLTAFRENRARTNILSKEVQHLQEEKSKQVSRGPSLALGSAQPGSTLLPSPLLQASEPRQPRAKVASWPCFLCADFTTEQRAGREF